jgi:hypothetical protein
VSEVTRWWELVIPAAAAVVGTTLGALMQGMNDRRRYKAEAEERRKTRFVEERRAVYVRYLAAFAEWEPLRAEAWRLRDEMDHAQIELLLSDGDRLHGARPRSRRRSRHPGPPTGQTNAITDPCHRSRQGSLPRAHRGPSFRVSGSAFANR